MDNLDERGAWQKVFENLQGQKWQFRKLPILLWTPGLHFWTSTPSKKNIKQQVSTIHVFHYEALK